MFCLRLYFKNWINFQNVCFVEFGWTMAFGLSLCLFFPKWDIIEAVFSENPCILLFCENVFNWFSWHMSPLQLFLHLSTCGEDNYNSDQTSCLITRGVSLSWCLWGKHFSRCWSVAWSMRENLSVGSRGCSACCLSAVFRHGSDLGMFSHTSASECWDGGVTAVVQIRKSAAMDLSR